NNVNGLDGSSLRASNGTAVRWDGYIDPGGTTTNDGTAIDYGAWTGLGGQQLKVTAGTLYTSPPTIVISRAGANVGQSRPTTINAATYNDVCDPVTGTTFRPSLQVVQLLGLTSGGTYASRPTLQISQPAWGSAATLKFSMAYSSLTIATNVIPSAANTVAL